MTTAKKLMTEAAEATLRGDADAVAKATAALAELDRNRSERIDSDMENLSKGAMKNER